MTDVNTDDTATRDEILEHMARAFFACAWADYDEEFGDVIGAGTEIMDVMPDELDPSAREAAKDLAERLEKQHGLPIVEIFRKAVEIAGTSGDREKSPEMFGHYAAMGAMGHGVSLYDAFGSKAAEFVNTSACYMEFTYFDLDPAKYPIPADAG